jgi:hypothetical protein
MAVSNIGDFNHDGYDDDIVVSAIYQSVGYTYLLFGSSS